MVCAGVVLLLIGMAMATVGFYSKPLSLVGTVNGTAVYDHSRRIQFASLSYIGPVIMGVGALFALSSPPSSPSPSPASSAASS